MKGLDFFPFISFVLISLIISAKVMLLKRKGINVTSRSGEKSNKVVALYFVFAAVFCIWLFEIAKPVFRFSFSFFPDKITRLIIVSDFIQISGVAIITISLVVMSITLVHFRNSLRFGLNENNRGKLITTGVFAHSRNPFFTSLLLWFFGISLIFPSPFFIGFATLAALSTHFFILKEEKFMLRIYGREYLEYRRKVRRYF